MVGAAAAHRRQAVYLFQLVDQRRRCELLRRWPAINSSLNYVRTVMVTLVRRLLGHNSRESRFARTPKRDLFEKRSNGNSSGPFKLPAILTG